MNNPYNKYKQVNNPYSKYQENAISTAPKEELTLMLYEGALKFCNQAIAATEEKAFDRAHDLILRVENIIEEFEATLNFKYDISKNLFSIYDYIFRRLLEADSKKEKNLDILVEVRGLLRELRDTWKEAMKIAKTEVEKV